MQASPIASDGPPQVVREYAEQVARNDVYRIPATGPSFALPSSVAQAKG